MIILKYAYIIWVGIVFTFWMIVLLPFFIIPYVFGVKIGGEIAFFFLKVWSYLFSWFNFIFFRVKGRHFIDKKNASIVVSNHTSFLDAPAFAIGMHGQCRPLGKKEMIKFPIFGWIYKMNVVIVDRSSSESRQRSLRELKKLIRQNISILIFPEGKMNRGDTILQPFYNGAFRLATELNIKIQPLIIENAINLMPRSGPFTIKPGLVTVNYLEPIDPEGMDVENLKNHCYDVMFNFLNRKKSSKDSL